MLRLYPVILDWLESLSPLIRSIERYDKSLADQLRRSSRGVCLNVAEGMGACGKCKTNSYRIALREMRESTAALDIAMRLEMIVDCSFDQLDRQQRIIGTLVKLAGFAKQ